MTRIPYKRRRQQLTNYKKRLKLIVSGTTRLVVRVSNKYVNCQLINYQPDGDLTLISFNSKKLSDYGFKGAKNLQSAYLTGYAMAKLGLNEGVKKAILDLGLQRSIKNSRIYAALKGAVDGGLKIPYGEGMLPSDELLKKSELSKVLTKLDKVKKTEKKKVKKAKPKSKGGKK